jgi:23S rRNA (uracil1939-C5)-methyltransferase
MTKTLSMNKQTLTIENIGTDGRGIARPPGESVVFVEGALPSERVEAIIQHEKKHFREAALRNVIQPSAHRILPPCSHYEACGGCNLQHAELQSQREFKKQWLLETLRRLGQWPLQELERAKNTCELIVSESENYRQRIRVHFDGKNIGFRARRSHKIVNISDCLVAHQNIRENWVQIRREITNTSSQHRISEFEITATQRDIIVEPVLRRNRTMRESTTENDFFEIKHPFLKTIKVHKQSFVQPHKEAMSLYAQKIHTLIEDFVSGASVQTLSAWDLYAGSGPFSMLASLVAEKLKRPCDATAVEGVGPATEALRANTAPWNVRCFASDVGEFCAAHADENPNIIILDPPRSGATPPVMDLISKACAPQSLVIYVACDAASLARDGRRLLEYGFSLESIHLYDTFAHTTHYETIAAFRRK